MAATPDSNTKHLTCTTIAARVGRATPSLSILACFLIRGCERVHTRLCREKIPEARDVQSRASGIGLSVGCQASTSAFLLPRIRRLAGVLPLLRWIGLRTRIGARLPLIRLRTRISTWLLVRRLLIRSWLLIR